MKRASWVSRRTRSGSVLCGLVVATVTTAVLPPQHAIAEEQRSEPAASALVSPGAAGADGQRVETRATVTLVTGDTVTYTKTADGQATATISGGRNGQAPSYHSYSDTAGGLYVVPQAAQPYLDSGALDRELFNVRYLVENGYDDTRTSSLPVIVTYAGQPAARSATAQSTPVALPGSHTGSVFRSIGGAGVTVDKARADQFWDGLTQAVTPAPGGRSATPQSAPTTKAASGRVSKVWLDRKVPLALDKSVPQIGAPEAWKAGYDGTGVKVAVLDGGVDLNHPDLAGKIIATQSFLPDPDVSDTFGHGTHVASTIAGSGAASKGRYAGVAQGARLLIGKICAGRACDESAIIAGMEWAAAQGADIVSMSVGGCCTDGTDPMAQTVEKLSASTDTLFVIAAGNDGPGIQTVGSPGVAPHALTVGAVSKQDKLAGFSSRGPTMATYGLKPEITAPGVDIVAARAAGTSAMGTPLDDYYIPASGTSMATPHVSGAAAILAQQHPDWTGSQIKAALVGSALDGGYPVWEQGAGRLDVARAIRQTVTADTPVLSLGGFPYPYTGEVVGRTVTYTNAGSADVTLSVSATVNDEKANPVAGLVTVDRDSLTVPAGGKASVQVTVDSSVGGAGQYSGQLVATGPGGEHVTTPIGFVKEARTQELTLKVTMPAVRPGSTVIHSCLATRVDDVNAGLSGLQFGVAPVPTSQPNVYQAAVRVPEGVYSVSCALQWDDAVTALKKDMWAIDPEVRVQGEDRTVDLDIRKAVPIQIQTPLPSEVVTHALLFSRTTESGETLFNSLSAGTPGGQVLALPTGPKPTVGSFKFWHNNVLAAPEATLTVQGGTKPVSLTPHYMTDWEVIPKFTTDQNLPIATAADLAAGRDVRGKLLWFDSEEDVPYADLETAAARGAAGVLAHSFTTPYWLRISTYARYMQIPLLWIDGEDAAALRAVLAKAESPRARIGSQIVSPYEYKLVFYELDSIPDTLTYTLREGDLTRIKSDYHAEFAPKPGSDEPDMYEVNHTFQPDDLFSALQAHEFDGPTSRTEYYNQTGRDVLWNRSYRFWNMNNDDVFTALRLVDRFGAFTTPTSLHERQNTAIAVPGQSQLGPEYAPAAPSSPFRACFVCRIGDALYIEPTPLLNGDPTHTTQWAVGMTGELYQGTEPVQPKFDDIGLPYFPVPDKPTTYTLRVGLTNDGQQFAKKATTEWTFTVGGKADTVAAPYFCTAKFYGGLAAPCTWGNLLQLTYDLDLALDNTAQADKKMTLTVTAAGTQPGVRTKVTSLSVQVSFDDGKTWTNAERVRSVGEGQFDVTVNHPKLAQSSGAVSLRTTASDADGNRVTQTIDRAYALR